VSRVKLLLAPGEPDGLSSSSTEQSDDYDDDNDDESEPLPVAVKTRSLPVVDESGSLTKDNKSLKNDVSNLSRRQLEFPQPGVPSSFLPLDQRLEQIPIGRAGAELKIVSQPKGVGIHLIKKYVWRVRQPYSTRLYIIDTGCDKNSEV
jgi:hypothetical protein